MSCYLFIAASAVCLGLYDVVRKHAVAGNSSVDVLLFSNISAAVVFFAFLGSRDLYAEALSLSWTVRAMLFAKAALVGTCWGLVYLALTRMPITIVAPVRATAPFWTGLGGILLYGETPSLVRALGMALLLCGFVAFAFAGAAEGFTLRGRGMKLVLAGTFLGGMSGIYDKYLLGRLGLSPQIVQLHFVIGLLALYLVVWTVRRVRWPREADRTPFVARWSVFATGAVLILADTLYFRALTDPDAPISVLSLLRRCSTVIAFVLGGAMFHDKNLKRKAVALAVVLLGVALVALGA